jgi:hypothetical protein
VQAASDVCDLEAIRRTLTGSLHAWLPCLVLERRQTEIRSAHRTAEKRLDEAKQA